MLNYQRVNDFPQGSQKHVYMEYNMILIDDIDVVSEKSLYLPIILPKCIWREPD